VACQDTHCLLCKTDYTTCTGCDTTNSWYLNGASCQSPTLTPQIPSGYGANTGTGAVVACQDTHCLLCKASYTTCTGCDTANSWYLNGASCQSPTLTPQIPSGYGANTGTGAVVACQDTHCLLCKASYTTCTGCDTANSWYLNGASCQSPTLTPQIPSGYGANTGTGAVVACQDTHCLLCKASYTTCTGCDTTNSWYLNGASCQSPTLTPQIPSGYGANTGTGAVVACQDTHCLLCKAELFTLHSCDASTGWYA
jgi:hypothetical protein